MASLQTLWVTHGATQPVVFVRTWHASSVSSDEQLLGLIAEEAWVQVHLYDKKEKETPKYG